MSQAPPIPDLGVTMADLLKRLGGIAPARVRLRPSPGMATEKDVIEIEARENRLYELVDGVLVEKVMGFRESVIASRLIRLIGNFVEERDLGVVTAPDGTLKLRPGLVRIPDVSFFAWSRFPGRVVPDTPIPDLTPDLAVEILSKGNTKKEMKIKLHDYFEAGSRLVWYLEPKRRMATVFTSADAAFILEEDQALDGGDVLPGLSIALRALFA